MRLRTLTSVALMGILSGAAAAAAEPPPPTYPVDNVLSASDNTERSLMDPAGVGRYQFEEGFYGAVRRAAQRYPERYLTEGIELEREAQVLVDSVTHNRPMLPYNHATDAGHPAYTPDWDHDGVFGDSGGYDLNGVGDFDADTDDVADTAYFLIPCYTPDDGWEVHRRYASGECDTENAAAEPYRIGIAHELKIIDARGLLLDATLWLPAEAFTGPACPAYGSPEYADRSAWTDCVSPQNAVADGSLPGVVFSNGFSSRQEHYAWFSMRMVDEGYVVLTYDPAGQGESEGTFFDTIGFTESVRADQEISGSVRDLQDVMRWFVGDAITRARDFGPRLVARADPTANAANPVVGALDTSGVAVVGNSMGALTTLAYLHALGSPGGLGADGRPLPPVAAAVSLSGARTTHAVVPLQFQTFDGDGSPTLIAPKVGGVNFAFGDTAIGYEPIKERYDLLRQTDDPAALSLIVIEGGSHADHVNMPYVPRTLWGVPIAADYAAYWLDCYVRGDAAACADSISPRPHLSRIYSSEYDLDAPSPSRCITIPDAWSLHQRPQDMLSAASGSPVYDCTP